LNNNGFFTVVAGVASCHRLLPAIVRRKLLTTQEIIIIVARGFIPRWEQPTTRVGATMI